MNTPVNTLASMTLAWLLTYALHSTILLAGARLVTRGARASVRDIVWKVALVGGIITSAAQVTLAIRPLGSVSLPAFGPSLTEGPTDRVATGGGDAATPSVVSGALPTVPTAAPGKDAARLVSAPRSEVAAQPSVTLIGGIVGGWATIALLLVGAYGTRRLILVGRLGDRRRVTGGSLPQLLDALRPAGGAPVTLTSSVSISSPVALGLREICVPEAAVTELGVEEQRGLLAHELAHLTRRDPLWLDAASILERVFFFQPLNRVARREMQLAAEHLCDDWAATRLGSGVPLAKCLAQVAEWIQASPLGVPMAGMAEQRSQLVTRIARLVERHVPVRPISHAAIIGGSVAALALVMAAAPGVHATASRVQATTPQDPQAEVPQTSQGQAGGANAAVVTALIERLSDTDARVRRAAASSLGNLSNRRAVPPLIEATKDSNREVRASAVESLGQLRDARGLNAILDRLRDTNGSVRQGALSALDNFEAEDLTAGPLVPLLKDPDADVRQSAAHLLGAIHDRATIAALLDAMDDASADVREEVIGALGEMKDRSLAARVQHALSDDHAGVRHAALEAMEGMKAPIAEDAVLDLLNDASADVRESAVSYVSDHPFAGAIPVLIRLLDDSNGDVRVEAVSALGEMRDPSAERAVRGALTARDPNVRARAAEVLGVRP